MNEGPRSIIITLRDVERCPLRALAPSHYYVDEHGVVHCGCEQPAQIIR
jgi:hypothetical protein